MPRNQTLCPVSDESIAEVLCAVDEDCVCANSSHIRELANVTVDGLACYACEPRRPPACTEAHDQCTPEACECGNPLTHVKRDATTVDGSPCHYCEPIGGVSGLGRPEFFMVLMVVSLVVMWQFLGRKPVSGRSSLRLSRRQGDRSRAIRVQQEPLRFYEEAIFMVGDSFDFLVDGAWEILNIAWQLLQRIMCCLSGVSPVKTLNAIQAFLRPSKDCSWEWETSVAPTSTTRDAKRAAPRRRQDCKTQEAIAAATCEARASCSPPKPAAPAATPAPSPAEAADRATSCAPKTTETSREKAETKSKSETKATRRKQVGEARTVGTSGTSGSAAKAAPTATATQPAQPQEGKACGKSASSAVKAPEPSVEVKAKAGQKGQGKQTKAKVDTVEVTADQCTSTAQTGEQSNLPKDVPELPSPSPLYKAAIAVMKASAVAAATEIQTKCFMQSAATVTLEELEGSTEGSIPPNDDEAVQTDSEDYDNRGSGRPNTAAAAAAILAAATDKRAAALQLLDEAAMPTIEVRTFLAEPDMEAPVMRRTVSDSDLALYA
mmetsp:Transcript_52109/g.97481  ORF Transcript_52109/g.97481 Transcript_52109/m.97481 type:complete len:549 (+) Transcript_52109:62-1708(+)